MPYKDDLKAALEQNNSLRRELENKKERTEPKKVSIIMGKIIRFVLGPCFILPLLAALACFGMVRCMYKKCKEHKKQEETENNNRKMRLKSCKDVCKRESKTLIDVKFEKNLPVITCECIQYKGTEFVNIPDPVKE